MENMTVGEILSMENEAQNRAFKRQLIPTFANVGKKHDNL